MPTAPATPEDEELSERSLTVEIGGRHYQVRVWAPEMTARSGTLVNSAIFLRSFSGRGCSQRQSRMSGWIPMERSSFTECCVGLVLISPAAGR